jgi:glycosyltransferase involved in cell wall biosynthesis
MKKNILVSVIIPAYNTQDYITSILESVINQTYKKIEIIIINDGSTDNTALLAETYLKDKDVVWRILNQQNSGLANARNIGIKNAKGDWIICPDSDDFIAPNTICRLLKSALKNNVQCAFCQYKNVFIENIRKSPTYDNGDILLVRNQIKKKFLFRQINIIVPGMIIHKSVFNSIEFDSQCPYSEDTLFIWKLIYCIDRVVCVNSDLYNYCIRQGSIIHSLTGAKCNQSIDQFDIMTKDLFISHPEDKRFIKYILPKFKISAQHVLAKCVSYENFLKIYRSTDKAGIFNLIRTGNIKLSLFAIIYLSCPRLYFIICNKIG